MDDKLLLRYSRQILLPEIDVAGQQRLLDSSAMVIGLGGLGSPVAMYLAASGVGRLVLVDFDDVELSNLQRQIIHGTDDLGRPKVESARDMVLSLNPSVRVETIGQRLDQDALNEAVVSVDAVVDATDNFESRFAINASCFHAHKPLISGAAIRFEGQVSVFFPGQAESPCYRCLYGDSGELGETCTQTGVVAPLLGMIGSVQAMETLKVIMGIGDVLQGRLLLLDALRMEWQSMRIRRDPDCPVCSVER
jgi:adenylyltransferase/sulfurtransferase